MKQYYETLMGIAIKEAEQAFDQGEVPIGAITLSGENIIAKAHNMKEILKDPTAHAELLVIRETSRRLGRWRLHDITLYVTIEPCAMCAGAIIQARIPLVVFGAKDPKGGCAGSTFQILNDPRLNHRVEIISGIQEERCRNILQTFFEKRRTNF